MDITTEAVRLGLNLAQVRAEIASTNIARANVSGAMTRAPDFADAVNALHGAVNGNADAAEKLRTYSPSSLRHQATHSISDTTISLDDQVAELSTQGLTYRALTDGLSRHFALMQLAIAGK